MTVPLKDYTLFTPYKLSESLELKNRIVMSPLTRARCDPVTHEAGPMQVEYYSQRAGAGLIITEAVAISVQGFGWYGAPCLYTEAHRDSWKPVVEAVHAKDNVEADEQVPEEVSVSRLTKQRREEELPEEKHQDLAQIMRSYVKQRDLAVVTTLKRSPQ
ncbi:hypothetical protein JG687_00006526 [Phytophthora cactorum]|uniref:NADH:flavin oxidoreductase/NADH oxidase N-terminal domain-containing protein n=1 Tax=Phytophthora cactorum TaxID=29920 RepID=A0A8T1UHQ4_9STRA|nr:hypothetical protein JG687_00006526 [Phytophthora cactorum]